MIDKGKKNILGVCINAIDYEAAVTSIIQAARDQRPLTVSALAVHGVMTGRLDSTQRYRLNHLDVVVPDGQPVRWALNWLYRTQLADRVYGPTLMLKLCERAAEEKLPIFLFGSRPPVLHALSENLHSRFPTVVIAGMKSSRFRRLSVQEKHELVQTIRSSGAALAFVGLGCPRQEVWIYEYRNLLNMPLIAVGAAFDFHAGTLPQAPSRLQWLGLEWAYRLLREPRRLWKRYALLNPLYLWLLLLQVSGLRHFDPFDATPPAQELHYG